MLWFNPFWFAKIRFTANFNTSYVVVQHLDRKKTLGITVISIHLMLWFNWIRSHGIILRLCISIHLMLWFNSHCWVRGKYGKTISIHLMLWFNHAGIIAYNYFHTFQYILCCGSTFFHGFVMKYSFDFNTSYVVVQL